MDKIKCTDCDKEAAVNIGAFPFCLTHAHATIDEAAAFHARKRYENCVVLAKAFPFVRRFREVVEAGPEAYASAAM